MGVNLGLSLFLFVSLYTTRASPISIQSDIYSLLFIYYFICICWYYYMLVL